MTETANTIATGKAAFNAVTQSQFARFIAVGVLNTVCGYAVFFVILILSNSWLLALVLTTVAGTLFNFATTGRLVFANRDDTRLWRFIGVYGAIFAVNAALLAALTALGLTAALAQALVLLPLAGLSFVLNRTLVFKGAK